jgi:hypothetical protein
LVGWAALAFVDAFFGRVACLKGKAIVRDSVGAPSNPRKRAGVTRAGVEVPAGGGDRAVAKRGLYQVDRRAVIQGVRRVGVPQPVGADVGVHAGALGRLAHDGPNAPPVQSPYALT